MISDLIVMTFSGEAAALRAKRALEQMRYSPFLGILNALVVTRDTAGKVVVHEQWELPAHLPSTSKQVPRLLVEACFGKAPDDGVQELVRAGLDETFVRCVVSALEPRSSMILSYIPPGSLVDAQQVLGAFGQLRGTLYHTTVPADVEESILELLAKEHPGIDS
jgi:uncharacterized membrane protein